MNRRQALALLGSAPAMAQPAGHTFAIRGDRFHLDGKPFVIRSGEMHYARIPREYWRDRMKKMRAMGLNTLCMYSFWNMHEPRPGRYNFSGDLDIAGFIRTAQEEGLWVLVRPGTLFVRGVGVRRVSLLALEVPGYQGPHHGSALSGAGGRLHQGAARARRAPANHARAALS